MGRTFSLRGTIDDLPDNSVITFGPKLFDYVSPDRRRAWKITGFWMFPQDWRADTGAVDGQFLLTANLTTEEVKMGSVNEIINLGDNRQCAWLVRKFGLRDSPVFDFFTPDWSLVGDGSALIDPDTMVVKELYLNVGTTSDSTTSPKRTWNYLVILEEIQITPSESILQQLKGTGQSIVDEV